jgi:hypothetical protein
MKHDWQELTKMTRGEPFTIERVRLTSSGIAVEGNFELPPMARLTMEDQVFVTAFLRISYPTVKNRLAAIAGKLEFVEINPPTSRLEVLEKLDKGEITADQALKNLGGGK